MTKNVSPSLQHTDSLEVEGELVLFGFPPSPATATVRLRERAWRVRGAIQIMAVCLVVAPVLALLPPHAPWPIGALGAGAILTRRRLSERATLLRLQGTCPKCGAAVRGRRARLREPHAVTCEGCHHEPRLRLSLGDRS